MNNFESKTAQYTIGSANIPKTPLRFLWYALRPHRFWFFSTVVVVVIASALSQSTSYFFKLIVDAT